MSKYSKYNWKKIQKYYDKGNFWKDIMREFKISSSGLNYGVKNNLIRMRNQSQSTKISRLKNPIKHSDKTKKKISEIRIKYLKENPDKVPYLLNHSRKESYPEKYFREYFYNENINVEKKFRIGLYELDFCIKDKKIDIEIDGEQHFLDKKRILIDEKRNKYLEELGWDIIRIRWSSYMKMNKEEKEIYLNNLKDYLNNLIQKKPEIIFKDLKKCECGNVKNKRSKNCIICYKNKIRESAIGSQPISKIG